MLSSFIGALLALMIVIAVIWLADVPGRLRCADAGRVWVEAENACVLPNAVVPAR